MLVIVAVLAAGLGIAARQSRDQSPPRPFLDRRPVRGARPDTPAARVHTGGDRRGGRSITSVMPVCLRAGPSRGRYFAQVLDNLHRAGARMIAVDIQFTEPSDPNDDFDAIRRRRPRPARRALHRRRSTATARPRSSAATPTCARPAPARGHRFIPDSDGIIRRMHYSIPGAQDVRGRGREVAGGPFAASSFGARIGPDRFRLSRRERSRRLVSTSGAAPSNARWSAGRIVFVGATARRSRTSTPSPPPARCRDRVSGERDRARSCAASPLRDVDCGVDLILIVLLGFAPAAGQHPSVRVCAGSRSRSASARCIRSPCRSRSTAGRILDLVDPLIALAVATMGSLAVLYLAETIERERVRGLFARFVPVSVVEQVLARTDENLRLGAVERDSTVLFSDLRGFTAFSEVRRRSVCSTSSTSTWRR